MIKLWKHIKKIRCRTLVILTTIFIFAVVYYYSSSNNNEGELYPRIIWWTESFPGVSTKIQSCGRYKCEISNDRSLKNHVKTMGYLFYGSDFNYNDIPLPRSGDKIVWGLLHEESPKNTPILSHKLALELFNYSSTFSRYSNVPLTLQYLEDMKDLLSVDHFVDTKKKNELLSEIAPILFIQSDCDTPSYRETYVKELMKYIKIDSYGKCLNNKKIPESLTIDYLNRLYSDEFLKFVGRYKFTISMENGICNDYITEKLWRPLKAGSVPIYMGSPSIRDWLPNDKSAIITSDFDSPKHLAAYIEYLNNHDVEYEKYVLHKTHNKITNLNLINKLKNKRWSVYEELFSDEFECYVCSKIHEGLADGFTSSIVSQSHYDCKEPLPPIDGVKPSWWRNVWNDAYQEAAVLNKLVVEENRSNFTESEFQSILRAYH